MKRSVVFLYVSVFFWTETENRHVGSILSVTILFLDFNGPVHYTLYIIGRTPDRRNFEYYPGRSKIVRLRLGGVETEHNYPLARDLESSCAPPNESLPN